VEAETAGKKCSSSEHGGAWLEYYKCNRREIIATDEQEVWYTTQECRKFTQKEQ
jgi:hypothetical protein